MDWSRNIGHSAVRVVELWFFPWDSRMGEKDTEERKELTACPLVNREGTLKRSFACCLLLVGVGKWHAPEEFTESSLAYIR